jgi:outer membrane protein assembly factor BamB
MRRLKWALTILAVLLVLVQSTFLASAQPFNEDQTDNWSMFRQNPAHTAFSGDNETSNSAELLWRYPVNRGIYASPTVADGLLFVGSRDQNMYCLNVSSGMPVWIRSLGWEIWSSAAVDNERVYFGVDDGNVYALNITNGDTVWKTPIGDSEVRSSPALVDGKIYIGSSSGMHCLDALDGKVIWNYSTRLEVYSSPAVSEGVVYFGCEDFLVHAVNATTGEELWTSHTGSITSSPCVQDGKVYVGSVYGYITCLNASDGIQIWSYETNNRVEASPALAYGQVYVGSYGGTVYCLNASSGSLVWQAQTGYWIFSSPAVADSNVYVCSEDQNIYCFNAFTGEQKWQYETGNIIESSPAVVNSTLYVCSYDLIIYAFSLTDSTIGNLPFQSSMELSFNTLAFDAIAVLVVATIIISFILIVRKEKQKTPKSQTITENKSWLKSHADMVCILAILAFSVVFFVYLKDGPLWVADEMTYSQWAFHMNNSGDYLTPWCFGSTNFWIAKPPLYMWMMALSYQIFGFSNFSTRIVSPIFAILTLIVVFYLGKMLFDRKTALISTLVLGTFATFFLFARHAMTDVTFLFFITSGIYFMLVSDKREKTNWYAALSGAFFGLALMTKQIQAFLLPIIVILYFIVTKKSVKFLFSKRFALFLGVGFLIFLPWLIYMLLQFGTVFSEWYFLYSGIERATIPIEGHDGGILYYLTYLIANENPVWVAALPFSIGLSAYYAFKRSKPHMLLIVWIFFVLGLFTFAQTKLYWYILPAFPALAFTIGYLFVELAEKIKQKRNKATG